uniref:(California timema) hypothetical protein n=1 Tax=Timema californicum TaxID=61474 RepID=A0A7R9JIA8_TIMCA|nr:unnamed protein product [Timema californicum]
MAAKEMSRNARRSQKQEKIEKEQCKKHIRRGNLAVAKIHAENSIRQRNQALNFMTIFKALTATLYEGAKMDRHIFNLKFAAKEMSRNARRSQKQEKIEKEQCKKHIRRGNLAVAKIHAENSIRQRNQALNFMTMSARVEAIAAKVQDAQTMNRVTNSLRKVSEAMDKTLKSMNLEKISKLMDAFENNLEELDVRESCVKDMMSEATTTAVPILDVEALLNEVAEEAGLDLMVSLPVEYGSVEEQDDLAKRLAKLRE